MTGRAWTVIALLVLAVAAGGAAWVRCEGTPPALEAPASLAVGQAGVTVSVAAVDAESGLRHFSAVLRHAGGERVLFEESFPGNLITGGTPGPSGDRSLELDPAGLELREGEAFLRVAASDWSWAGWLAGNASAVEVPVTIDLTAPRVQVESGLTYVRRAGSAAVVYRLTEPTARDGVEVGEHFFPGHPLPGVPEARGRRVALFAVPRDAPADVPIRVVAYDAAGNRTARGWNTRLQERRFEDVRIALSQRFMEGKVAELSDILGIDQGDPVANFQKINREVRAANEQRIREIVAEASSEPMWSGGFLQMRNSAVTSRFAEHRSYTLDGDRVSEAIHFGYDLASTAGAPIEASAAGRVLFADELGIYGNCVILDHGLGLASLYAHLSAIGVGRGDRVERGQVIGRSGATGLAGGDHLHFAILVGGVYVDSKEWWDSRWVRDHVEVRLRPEAAPQ